MTTAINHLQDPFGRVHSYLRIGVAEQCNLRCIYCMPEKGMHFAPEENLLSTGEILRVLRVGARLGLSKVRFTGGEPLVRRDIEELLDSATKIDGIRSVHLTTNGLLLGKHLPAFKRSGLTGLNISLDTLNAARFLRITRRNGLEKVIESIHKAIEIGIPKIKLNVVALKDFNTDELVRFVEFTRDHPVTVRFIELMPFNSQENKWREAAYTSAIYVQELLKAAYPELSTERGTATEQHSFSLPGYKGTFAIIPAYTRSLCEACTRLRVTADGKLMNCLYSTEPYNLRD
ncbi:MAG: GTP 3',8-cyclase MoaA, partial [Chlorobiales bacterium]|nr:GTP 3',8-cyclase MoaA [Chlorobiales bacterium]